MTPLDFDDNRDGTVTVYPPFVAGDPLYRRDGFAVRLDESDLRMLLKKAENA